MGDTITVDVKPAWASKINLGELIKAAAAIAATKGLDIPVEIQNDILLVIVCGGAIYTWVVRTWFTKAVTASSISKALLIALAVPYLIAPSETMAADLPAAIKGPVKAAAAAPPACAPASCSGWYFGLGLTGNGTSADISGNGVNQSVFAAGGILDIHGGYQLWSGSYLFAAEAGLGNQFQNGPLNQFGSKSLVGYELVKFGGDLSGLVNQQNSATPPGQASGSLNVPQSLASQFIALYIALGAVQRKGLSEWVTGAGSEFVLARNWNLDIRYLYAPAQSGLDAMNLVTIGANYHFSAK
jgi:hypothetical protein